MQILGDSIRKINRILGKILGAFLIQREPLQTLLSGLTIEETSFSQEEVPSEDAAIMNIWPKAKNLQAPTYRLPKVFTTHLQNVTFCAAYNTILTDPFTIIQESISTVNVPRHRFNLFEHFKPTESISGLCSTFRSVSEVNFYHTLIDCIPRLYLLHASQYQELAEIKLLCSGELKGYEQYLLDRILPENVTLLQVSRDKNYSLEEIIFPSFMTQDFAGYLPEEYIEFLLKRVAPNRPRRKDRRIFIARAIKSHKKAKSRIIYNEDQLFEAIEPYGFEKYYLEKMTIEEQIELFYDAEYVVAAHGAGLSNLIFAEQAGVVELFPTPYVLPYFYFVCKSCRHDYYYWCGTESHRDSNFKVDIPAVEATLETCLKAPHTFRN